MSKILVTGGCGFIGSHLVDRLISLNHEVVILDNLSFGSKSNLNPKAEFVEGDVLEDLDNLFEKQGFEYVFHLAAQIDLRKSLVSPKEDANINIVGSLNLIENCIKHKVKKFIFSSSGAVYGENKDIPLKEDYPTMPSSPYALAKLTTEKYLQLSKELHGLEYVALRYSNVFGPRQGVFGESGVVGIFAKNLFTSGSIIINGDGNQTRDFIFVEDIVNANVLAMNLSGIFNVSSNKETSVNEVVETIKRISNKDFHIVNYPEVKGEIRNISMDNKKISEQGWKLNNDFESGVRKTLDFFENYKDNSVGKDIKKIFYIGRIAPIKNFETVIKALPLLKEKNIVLELAGPGEEEYVYLLKDLVKQFNLEDQVIFSPAIWDVGEKIKKIDGADVFILPSKSEGMPQSLIEAMARKKIVIASDNNASKDLINDERNGFLFPIGDEKTLAKTLEKVFLLSEEEKIFIGNEARKSVDKFSWDKIISKVEKLITN